MWSTYGYTQPDRHRGKWVIVGLSAWKLYGLRLHPRGFDDGDGKEIVVDMKSGKTSTLSSFAASQEHGLAI